MKILVVDESTTMRRIAINTLARIGYKDVIQADSGKSFLQKLDEGGVDIIMIALDDILDMDGPELTMRVRSGPHREVPILMVTSSATKERIEDALRSGVNNYLVKPYTANDLKEKIDSVRPNLD